MFKFFKRLKKKEPSGGDELRDTSDDAIIAKISEDIYSKPRVPRAFSSRWPIKLASDIPVPSSYVDFVSGDYSAFPAGTGFLEFPFAGRYIEQGDYPPIRFGTQPWSALSIYDSYVSLSPDDIPYLSRESKNSIPSPQDEISSYEVLIDEYKETFSKEFRYLLETEIFEDGIENEADIFVAKWITEHPSATRECLNALFNQNIRSNPSTVAKILRIIGHLDYRVVSPEGPTMAGLALNNKSTEVQECAIAAFENWGMAECLEILVAQKYADKWLQEYVAEVIAYIKEEVDVSFGPEN